MRRCYAEPTDTHSTFHYRWCYRRLEVVRFKQTCLHKEYLLLVFLDGGLRKHE